ncbi:MAG: hypothetical protein ACRBN8_08955 [Nannocystales bacterium]
MSVVVERRPLADLEADEHVLVVTPQVEVGLAEAALDTAGGAAMRVDQALVTAATASPGTTRISVLVCNGPDGGGTWGFPPDLDPSRLEVVAQRLCAAQLRLFRRLFAAGVSMHVRLSLGSAEQLALRRAQADLRGRRQSALESSTGLLRELIALDIWLLRNFVFQFDLPVGVLLERTLGANGYAVSAKMRAAGRRRAALSPEAVSLLSAGGGRGSSDEEAGSVRLA